MPWRSCTECPNYSQAVSYVGYAMITETPNGFSKAVNSCKLRCATWRPNVSKLER